MFPSLPGNNAPAPPSAPPPEAAFESLGSGGSGRLGAGWAEPFCQRTLALALALALAPALDGDGQNRDGRQAHQLFGDAAQEQMGEAGAPVRAEDHQIVLAFLQLGE